MCGKNMLKILVLSGFTMVIMGIDGEGWSTWSDCDILVESNITCGNNALASQWRSKDCTSLTCIYKEYHVRKCQKPCPASCSSSVWSAWSICNLDGECGNGYRVRQKRGSTNAGERCGVSPIHIQSCYVICNDTCKDRKENYHHTHKVSEERRGVVKFPNSYISSVNVSFREKLKVPIEVKLWLNSSFGSKLIKNQTLESNNRTVIKIFPVEEANAMVYQFSVVIKNPPSQGIIGEAVFNVSGCQVPFYSNWEDWSICKRQICNRNGTQSRFRICAGNHSSGVVTNLSPIYCRGLRNESRSCMEPCSYTWTQWQSSECKGGICGNGARKKTRACMKENSNITDNSKCKGNDTMEEECYIGKCYEDPSWSNWDNSSCDASCGGGKMLSMRKCIPKKNMCNGESKIVSDCNENSCPVHGNFSAWSNWTECSTSCGVGQKFRLRTCSNPYPLHGGGNCTGLSKETESCNMNKKCPGYYLSDESTDCYSFCRLMNLTCLPHYDETQKLTFENHHATCSRNVNKGEEVWSRGYHPSYNLSNQQCEGFMNISSRAKCQNKDIPPNIRSICNCQSSSELIFGKWSIFGECSRTCGYGIKTRYRQCLNTESCKIYDKKSCSETPCPVDGEWLQWSPWKECSKPCGGGIRKKVRYCKKPLHGGRECSGTNEYSEKCNLNICPVHGGFSEWTSWSQCDRPCGGGNQTRWRYCNNPKPQFDGRDCVGNTKENQKCLNNPCPSVKLDVVVIFNDEVFKDAYLDLNSTASKRFKDLILRTVQELYLNHKAKVKDIVLHELRNYTSNGDDRNAIDFV